MMNKIDPLKPRPTLSCNRTGATPTRPHRHTNAGKQQNKGAARQYVHINKYVKEKTRNANPIVARQYVLTQRIKGEGYPK